MSNPTQTSSLKIACLNIESDRHLDRVVPFLKKEEPDIVLLQEVLFKDIPYLEEVLQMKSVSTVLNLLEWGGVPQNSGLVTFSTLPIINTHSAYYKGNKDQLLLVYEGEAAETVAEKTSRAILVTDIVKDGQQYRLVNTHFTWSPEGQATDEQHQNLKILFQLLSPLSDFILCGDFNAPRGRAIFDAIASRYKDNIPLHVTTTIDKNLHRAGDLQLVIDGFFTTPQFM